MFCEAIERISYGLKNEFELAVVNEPSVFELLRFDCICLSFLIRLISRESRASFLWYFLIIFLNAFL